MKEGARVSFVGTKTNEGPAIGDIGTVLADSGEAGHVMWTDGARKGEVDFLSYDDVVAVGKTSRVAAPIDMSDTLAFGPALPHVAVREVMEESGEAGLLAALADAGHLSGIEAVAETVLEAVAGLIRSDETMASVLAQLDEDEADRFVATTARAMVTDVFGAEDET